MFQLKKKQKSLQQSKLKKEFHQLSACSDYDTLNAAVHEAKQVDMEIPESIAKLLTILHDLRLACDAREEGRLGEGIKAWQEATERYPGVGESCRHCWLAFVFSQF